MKMSAKEIPIEARIARPSDHKAIRRLCRRAVGSGDYVLRILREVIADHGLFLAWSGDELVGMTHLERCIDGSGWMSMARTDPHWRRKGVALFLQRQIEAHAKRKRMRFLRLWALSNNRPSILACTKAGFRPVSEAAHLSYHFRTKQRLKRPSLSYESNQPFESLLKSPYLTKTNGYLAYKWHFLKANKQLFRKLHGKGELYQDDGISFIITKPKSSFGVPYSSLTLLQGSPLQVLRKVKQVARRFGSVWLGSYLPYEPYLLRSAKACGFRRDSWATHCIVFEKAI